MTSNFRIVLWHTSQGDVYSIHEVEYNALGEPTHIHADPVTASADSGQHLSNLLMNMCGAFREPVLDSDLVLSKTISAVSHSVRSFLGG